MSKHHKKDKLVKLLAKYNHRREQGISQRKCSEELSIPRKTIEDWQTRREEIPLAKEIIDFFESPVGFGFLNSLLISLQLTMTQIGGYGIRSVSRVLELTGLSYFVGSSYECLRQRGIEMENRICDFADKYNNELSSSMPHKEITVAQDETFHPKACLVAIEPVSNFIIMERYADNCKAETWNNCFEEATSNLNVSFIQSTSDEGSSILSHVEQDLKVHHSPDLFHIKNDIFRGINPKLSGMEAKSIKDLDELYKKYAKSKEDKDLKDRISKKIAEVKNVKSNHIKVLEAENIIGNAYHPYDLTTAKANTHAKLESTLAGAFNTINKVANLINLRETGKDLIAKAKAMIPSMTSTLDFYFDTINNMLKSLGIKGSKNKLMKEFLIPSAYLDRCIRKAKNADSKRAIKSTVKMLQAKLSKEKCWISLSKEVREKLVKYSFRCADVFQRSSSCVEGRNGYLSLRHHGLHNISDRKLKVLTTIHNYFIRRPDGTTAAQRFYEQEHGDIFEYLIEKMTCPARSRKSVLKVP